MTAWYYAMCSIYMRYNRTSCSICTTKVIWLCTIRKSRLHISRRGATLFLLPQIPPTPHQEQPAAPGQQPPNCWGVGVFPYLIALDDVIDLPQVVTATCFVADLQQHQAYFLLSQFNQSDFVLPSLLKYTVGKRNRGGVRWVDYWSGHERKRKHID